MRKKIIVIFGTRPEAIKMAPVIKILKEDDSFETLVCSTGQHREMLKQVLDIFQINIDSDLDLMKPNQDLYDITANSLLKLRDVLNQHKPDVLLVQGDTTTAFASALAAFYSKVKVGHVEAGLRSYNIYSPYPEESNRRFISVLSEFNFAPTNDAKENLLKEGFKRENIFVTGNTVIDSLEEIKIQLENDKKKSELEEYFKSLVDDKFFEKEFILITMHRREKFGEEFKSVLSTLKELAQDYPHYNFIYPVHLNPNVKKPVENNLSDLTNFKLVQPLDYLKFIFLMSRCRFILSDSGGVQEECFVFNKPIIVMRDVTERNEAIKAGYAFLTGSDKMKIMSNFKQIDENLLNGHDYFNCENPFGDGNSAERIMDILKKAL